VFFVDEYTLQESIFSRIKYLKHKTQINVSQIFTYLCATTLFVGNFFDNFSLTNFIAITYRIKRSSLNNDINIG